MPFNLTGQLLLLGPEADGVDQRPQPGLHPRAQLEEASVPQRQSREKKKAGSVLLDLRDRDPIMALAVPVLDADVSVQVELAVVELDHGEASAAHYADFVHAGDAAFQDHGHVFQDFSRSRSGQIEVLREVV